MKQFFKGEHGPRNSLYLLVVALFFVLGTSIVYRAVQVASCDQLVTSCQSFLGNNSPSPSVQSSKSNLSSLPQSEATMIARNTLSDVCKLDAKLASPCRPLMGTASYGYPEATGWKGNIDYFEKRAGRQVEVVHSYHKPDQTSLSKDEIDYVNRPNTLLYMNWKPDYYWSAAAGGNANVNAKIDKMADSVKALGSRKIMLALYHEPEDDISKGGSKCSNEKGDKGTTQEYREMWRNVRNRFNAKGVTNVVWVMNYMSWHTWDCAVLDLWPGNDLVDWVTWDPYTSDNSDFKQETSRFYDFLAANSDASHNFTSKNWGIGEMGYIGSNQQKAYKYYDDMMTTIQKNELPRLKMYLFFDMIGVWDSRIGYTSDGKKDPVEQQHFNKMFAGVVGLKIPTPAPTPPPVTPDPTPSQPTPQPQAPGTTARISVKGITNGSTVSGTLDIAGITDDKNVQLVAMRVDGEWVATDTDAPYAFKLETQKYSNGKHTLLLRIQINGKKYDSLELSFTVNNTPVAGAPVTVSGIKSGDTVKGTVSITGIAQDVSSTKLVSLRVDGEWVASDDSSPYTFKLDTRKFKNGQHTLILRGWLRGVAYDSPTVTFNVKN